MPPLNLPPEFAWLTVLLTVVGVIVYVGVERRKSSHPAAQAAEIRARLNRDALADAEASIKRLRDRERIKDQLISGYRRDLNLCRRHKRELLVAIRSYSPGYTIDMAATEEDST